VGISRPGSGDGELMDGIRKSPVALAAARERVATRAFIGMSAAAQGRLLLALLKWFPDEHKLELMSAWMLQERESGGEWGQAFARGFIEGTREYAAKRGEESWL
jgi:hypothetical protein